MKRSCRAAAWSLLLTAVFLASAEEVFAEGAYLKVLKWLDEPMDTKVFQQPMTLKEFLGLMMEDSEKKMKLVSILVDTEAFKQEHPEAPSIYDTPVQFIGSHKLPVRTVLDSALSKVSPPDVTFVVRQGRVWITTKSKASFDHLRQQRIRSIFEDKKLVDVLDELIDQTGVNIVLDPRSMDKAKRPVRGAFQNAALDDVLIILADQADLKVVALSTAFYITTRERAAELRRELNARKAFVPAPPRYPRMQDDKK